jgi:hypothetical protein
MSLSMKDLDTAFHGAGQKEYPFSLASLYYVLFQGLTSLYHRDALREHRMALLT